MRHPLLISTWSFGLRGNRAAWPALDHGGSSLDAVEHVCRIVETDEEVDSVGYGCLLDRDGGVSLDGCVMLSPARCGAVCAMRRSLHPVSVARRLMDTAAHVMLAGEGADAFAGQHGFERADLIAPASREKWLEWKRGGGRVDQSRDRGYEATSSPDADDARPDPEEGRWSGHDTIGALSIDVRGVLAGACSTSGTPYKMPGRVGDSPIIGHGLYVDPAHGAAVATGEGELIMGLCSSFLVVESMRRGASALDAIADALRRYPETYELKDDHQVGLLALQPDGTFASGALRRGFKVSVTDRSRSEIIEPDALILD